MDSSNNVPALDKQKQAKPLVVDEEELLERLLIDGQYAYGDSQIFSDGRQMPWLDLGLAQSGQKFFQKHYFSLIFAHALYFGMGFGFKPITALVIKTQSVHGVLQMSKRALSTVWHVLRWYEHDLIGVYSEGYKAVSRIRKTHESVRKKSQPGKLLDFDIEEDEDDVPDALGDALGRDLKFLDTSVFEALGLTYDPVEPISQFSLAITQIAFLLPVMAHPKAFGIKDLEGVKGLEHLWALIGRLMGIEDKFNIPLISPSREFYTKIWNEIWLPNFLVRDSKIKTIQESYYNGVGQFMPQVSVPVFIYFYLSQSGIEGFVGSETYKLLSLWEKFCLVVLRGIFKLLGASHHFRNFSNWIVRLVVRRVLQNFNPEEGYGSEATTLPVETEWTLKYSHRQSSAGLQKWKTAQSMLNMMTTAKIRWKKRHSHKKSMK